MLVHSGGEAAETQSKAQQLYCWSLYACSEGDLQAANFGANEANAHLSELRAQVDQLAMETKHAEEGAAAAAGGVKIRVWVGLDWVLG